MTTVDIRGVSGRPIRASDNAYGFEEALTTANAVRESTWQAALELLGLHLGFATSASGPWGTSSAGATHFRMATGTTRPVDGSGRWSVAIPLGSGGGTIDPGTVTPDNLSSTNVRVAGYIYGNVNANTGEWIAPPPRNYSDLNGIVPLADLPSSIPRFNNSFRFGSGAPTAGLGIDGDGYLDTSAGIFYTKASGTWSSQYTDQVGSGGTGVTVGQVNGLIQTALSAAVSGNTETGITVTYNNDGTIDFVVGGVVTHPTLVGGLSADATPITTELTIEGSMGMITFGAVTDQRVLIGRLASEPPITSVLFSNDSSQTNQLGVFTLFGSTVTYDGAAYSILVGNELVTTTTGFTATVA